MKKSFSDADREFIEGTALSLRVSALKMGLHTRLQDSGHNELEIHRTGVAGELAACIELKIPRSEIEQFMGHSITDRQGYDLPYAGRTLEVKASRVNPAYVSMPVGSTINARRAITADIAALVSLPMQGLEWYDLRGWQFRFNWERDPSLLKVVNGDLIVVKRAKLFSPQSLIELTQPALL
jgi:hypothetical protein